MPCGPALVLNLLRWGDEVKPIDSLDLAAASSQKISAAEKKMALQLVSEMSGQWKPDDFKDEFKEQVMALVERKREAGDTESVMQPEETAPESAEVIDLTALLKRSLGGGGKKADKKPKAVVAKTTTSNTKTKATTPSRKTAAKAPAKAAKKTRASSSRKAA